MPQTADGLVLTDEFTAALEHLESGRHLFLTGKAGTGKSTLILHFLDTTRRTVTVVAPTGIAALNVDGYTIHRLFFFYPGISVGEIRSGRYYPGRFAQTVKKLQTLIIDEASMVRADLLDCVAAALERYGPAPGQPFGGVQIVLVGDLYQLPPVVQDAEKEWLDSNFETPYFFSAKALAEVDISTIELSRVFRQEHDGELVHILNAVREGHPTPAQLEALNARTRPGFEPPVGEFWVTLTTTNRLADSRNKRSLEQLPLPEIEFHAEVRGDTDGFEDPTSRLLRLRVGAQVMMLTNDPLDRWVNGTIARVVAIEEDDEGPLVQVSIPGEGVVDVRPHTWEITRPRVDGGRLTHDVIGIFTQLPFRLAWAITIHKSQGQTLDRLVVDLTGGTFADGQLYVALSRATSLEGLVLQRPVLAKHLRVDARVRRFLTSRAHTSLGGGRLADLNEELTSRIAFLAVCLVGDEGQRWKPRPIEIAAVTHDGVEATTLVNPTRDLGDANSRYGLKAGDVQLAPRLSDAWPVLTRLLAGHVPVAVDVDNAFGQLKFELNRGGLVPPPMPLGIEAGKLPRIWDAYEAMDAEPTALGKARALREVVLASGVPVDTTGHTPFEAMPTGDRTTGPADGARDSGDGAGGYLLPRSTPPEPITFLRGGDEADFADRLAANLRDVTPTAANRRVLAALAEELSVPLGFPGVGGNGAPGATSADGTPGDATDGADATGNGATGRGAGPGAPAEAFDPVSALVPGSRVCFTGEPTHEGRVWGRAAMEQHAAKHGLIPVANVTKTKCELLVVAEEGSQSGKACNAAKWGKPVVTAAQYFAWAAGEDPAATKQDAPPREVRVLPV